MDPSADAEAFLLGLEKGGDAGTTEGQAQPSAELNHAGTAQISSLLLMPEAATSGSLRASSKKLQQWGIGQGNGTYKSLSHSELCDVIVILVHIGCCAAHHTLVKAIAIVLHISSHLYARKVSDLLRFSPHTAFG